MSEEAGNPEMPTTADHKTKKKTSKKKKIKPDLSSQRIRKEQPKQDLKPLDGSTPDKRHRKIHNPTPTTKQQRLSGKLRLPKLSGFKEEP